MAPINPYAFDNRQHILRKTIALHYVRQGNFEVGDMFAKASHCVVFLLSAQLGFNM